MSHLAEALDSSKAAVQRIETGQRSPTFAELEHICEVLGVTMLAFIEDLDRAAIMAAGR